MTMETLRMLPTGRLKIDPSYQRALNEQRVRRMATGWCALLAQTIDVSERGGEWYVLDGQHRLAAARMAGVPELAATVYNDLTPSAEARLFVELNTLRSRPSAADIFRAQLQAGDQTALSVLRAAAEADVDIDINKVTGGNKPPRATRSVGALLAVHAAGGETLVRETLSSLRAAWPEERKALEAVPIFGVASFIVTYRKHPRYEYGRIARKLGEVSASAFLRRVSALSEGQLGGSSGSTVFQKAAPRKAVLEAFNRDLRGERLPDATQSDFKRISLGDNPWTAKAVAS
jgi:hypothetical protein